MARVKGERGDRSTHSDSVVIPDLADGRGVAVVRSSLQLMVSLHFQESQARSRFTVLRRTFSASATFRSTWKSNMPTQMWSAPFLKA